MERREQYIDQLESFCSKHSNLIQLVKQCLNNVPNERLNTDQLLTTLQRMKVEVEGEYGGPIRLDMVRVRLAKEVKVKDRKIVELTQQQVDLYGVESLPLALCPMQVTQGAELQEKDRRIVELTQQQVYWYGVESLPTSSVSHAGDTGS